MNMDFKDQIKQLGDRVIKLKDQVNTTHPEPEPLIRIKLIPLYSK